MTRRASDARPAPSRARSIASAPSHGIAKATTGIEGLDELTGGGLPRGRTTLIAGSAGCGKTLFGIEFLVHGARKFGEPGVFVAFEETVEDLTANVRSLGIDLPTLERDGRVIVDHVRVERGSIEESGEYDLGGLFVRLAHAIDSIGARRVVLDTLEVLFSSLDGTAILRSELKRLFRWLSERGVTAIVTAERGSGALTRHGLEEYVSDCVIALDHRTHEQITTRRLRVVKYRGSAHGTNEYPFLIDADGITVVPITSLALDHPVVAERVSTGVPALDEMFAGGGFHRGSTVLVSGTAGAGKSSLAASFADAACARGEKVLYVAMEESPAQIVRNMRSIGIDLGRWQADGRLVFHAMRPSLHGLEAHLAMIHRQLGEVGPAVVIVDPITNLDTVAPLNEVRGALTRLVDQLKSRGITAMLTSLTTGADEQVERSEAGISSLIDVWLLLSNLASNGERNRGLYVLKARGTGHSNQIREFRLTDAGIRLEPPYVGSQGVLAGTARLAQEARDRDADETRRRDLARKRRLLARRRERVEAEIAALRAALAAETAELQNEIAESESIEVSFDAERDAMSNARQSSGRRQPPVNEEKTDEAGTKPARRAGGARGRPPARRANGRERLGRGTS